MDKWELFNEAMRRIRDNPPDPAQMAEKCEKLAAMFPERADEYLKDAAWFRDRARSTTH